MRLLDPPCTLPTLEYLLLQAPSEFHESVPRIVSTINRHECQPYPAHIDAMGINNNNCRRYRRNHQTDRAKPGLTISIKLLRYYFVSYKL